MITTMQMMPTNGDKWPTNGGNDAFREEVTTTMGFTRLEVMPTSSEDRRSKQVKF